jgi:hypothetical protein
MPEGDALTRIFFKLPPCQIPLNAGHIYYRRILFSRRLPSLSAIPGTTEYCKEINMRYLCALLIVCAASTSSRSQDYPREQVSIGYSYLNADTNGLSSRENVPIGLNAGFIANVSPRIGIETNFGAYYKKIDGFNVYDYSLTFGPRFVYDKFFFHTLLGMDGLVGSADGGKATQAGPAVALGGGITFPIARHARFETWVDYVATDHNIVSGGTTLQSNLRAVASIVFTFGHSGSNRGSVQIPTDSSSQPLHRSTSNEGLRVTSLGLMATVNDHGAEIVEMASDGVAAHANMQVGDVINEINGSTIKTPLDLGAALSSLAPGSKVQIGYLIRGQWQSETVIIMPEK